MSKAPSRKHRHNAEVRTRILSGASALFRDKGFAGVSIDAVMAEAGLTRGAFYAHFKTKDSLFTKVIRSENLLLRLLENRSGPTARDLAEQAIRITADYLRPGSPIARGCTLATLARDASQQGSGARIAFEAGHDAVLAELAREQAIAPDDPRLVAALTQAIGSVTLAAACETDTARTAVLSAGLAAALPALETALNARHPGPDPLKRASA